MRKKIIFISLGTVVVIATPVALCLTLINRSGSKKSDQSLSVANKPGGQLTDADRDEINKQELADFSKTYPEAVSDDFHIHGTFFNDKQDLPDNFTIPKLIDTIEDGAFKGALLPNGFAIPKSVKISKDAFSDAKTAKDSFWYRDGIKVDAPTSGGYDYKVINPQKELDDFLLKYPGTVVNGVIVENAFKNQDLSNDFSIPILVNAIGGNAFDHAIIPSGFSVPLPITSIDEGAFAGATLPLDFSIFNTVATIGDKAFDGATLPSNSSWFKDGEKTTFPSEGGHQYLVAEVDKQEIVKKEELAKFKLRFPGSVTDDNKIVTSFFRSCKDLPDDFSIPSLVTEIGAHAFEGADLPPNFNLFNSITTIGDSAFSNANFLVTKNGKSSFSIPKSVTSIGNYAFKETNITTSGFVFPINANSVGKGIFSDATLPNYFTIPSPITSIGDEMFEKATFSDDFIITPNITSIGASAFSGAILPNNFIIPDSVTSIGASCFEGTNLSKGLTLSHSLTTISDNAFKGAQLLDSFNIPANITAIGASAFSGAFLPLNFVVPNTVTSIDASAFAGAVLPTKAIWTREDKKVDTVDAGGHQYTVLNPDNLELNAFKNNYPGTVNSKNEIVNNAFKDAILPEGFTIPSLITSIGLHAFEGAKLPASFQFPNNITKINDFTFAGATLPDVFVIPSSVTEIGNSAFEGATLPIGFVVSRTVTSIGTNAFKDVILPTNYSWYDSKNSQVDELTKANDDYSIKKVDDTQLLNFMAKYPGKVFNNRIIDNAFKGKFLPNDFSIPNLVISIGAHAFDGATLPSGFTVPNSVLDIGDFAFSATRYKGTEFTLPNSIKAIGKSVFAYAVLPSGFKLPNSVTIIDDNAFNAVDFGAGSSFVLPKNVVTIGAGAFKGTSIPASFTLPTSLTSIGANAFENADLKNSFSIPFTVNTIGTDAFKNVHIDADSSWFQDEVQVATVTTGNHNYSLAKVDNHELEMFIKNYPGTVVDQKIVANAFKNKVLPVDFAIPNLIKEVGVSAFEGATLPIGFSFPTLITSIQNSVFKNAHISSQFTISSSITSIGENAFEGASISSDFQIPYGVTSIGANAFKNCSLTADFIVPKTVTSLASDAFSLALLPNSASWSKDGQFVVDFKTTTMDGGHEYKIVGDQAKELIAFTSKYPDSVINGNKIKDSAFFNKSIPADFKLPSLITSIGNLAFSGATLPEGFIIPNTITSIGESAFSGVKIPNSFILPSSVSTISKYLFSSATIPNSFVVPKWISSIGDGAFSRATLPTGFAIPKSVKTIGKTIVDSAILPAGTSWYSDVVSKVSFPNDGDHSYELCVDDDQELKIFMLKYPGTVFFPNKLIVENAFKGRANLPIDFALPKKIVDISPHAFENTALNNCIYFVLPNTVTTIPESAFAGAYLPRTFKFSSAVTSIANNAFNKTQFAGSFTIPSTITSVGADAFKDVELPEGFVVPKTINSIGDGAFSKAKLPHSCFWFRDNKYYNTKFDDGSGHHEYKVIDEIKFFEKNWPGLLANNNTFIGKVQAFKGKNVPENFYFPSTVTRVADEAFADATVQAGFIIPATIDNFSWHGFVNMTIPDDCIWLYNGVYKNSGPEHMGRYEVVKSGEQYN